jgi:hypothetical protein
MVSAELTIPEAQGKTKRCFALMQDVSRGGFSIVHPIRLAAGQPLDITFNNQSRTALVAWSKPLPGKHFLIGCRFIDD